MLFNDFFDSILSSWNRSFKEKDGYTVMESKNHKGIIAIFNTLGVSADDIKVTTSDASQTCSNYNLRTVQGDMQLTYLRVTGNTKIPEMNDDMFSANYELVFRHANPICKVEYAVRDGLTIVYIETETPDVKTLDAKRIADGGSFTW